MKIPFLRINIKLKNPVKFIWLKAIEGPSIDFRVPELKRSSQVNIIGFEAEWTILDINRQMAQQLSLIHIYCTAAFWQ